MPRYMAFLRAINVGGRVVKMDVLRSIFEGLDLKNVTSYIASGNLIFESGSKSPTALERRIEAQLREELGYEVHTMLRTDAQVAAIAEYVPFDPKTMESALSIQVGFLSARLSTEASAAVARLETDVDSFRVHGSEVYWMAEKGVGQSKVTNVKFEKATGTMVTFRNVKTVRKLAALYPPS